MRRGPRAGWHSTVPHGNGRRPHLTAPGLRNHFVYWVFDATGDVIYVGCTRNPEQRWAEHKRSSRAMFADCASKRMAGPYDYPTARRIEAEQQEIHRPRHVAKYRRQGRRAA